MKAKMTKVKISKKRTAKKVAKTAKKKQTVKMGPVTTISTAPVAMGNSVRGTKSFVTPINNGVRVIGRDFMFTPIGSGSVTTWTLVGGTPLSPAAFSDSCLRQYMQMYQKYRWLRCTAHYITSSPTSANGDVMFYRSKNRDSVFLSQTSTQLLPFVISDPDTVIGPQWTNHSVDLTVSSVWKSTDYGMTAAVNQYSDGDLFLLSKTSTTDSPGYVLFDYDIEFAEMNISPRLLSLPLPRAQWSQTNFSASGAVTSNSTIAALPVGGNNISGTSAVVPVGATQGDIYKCIIDLTNSSAGSWTNVTASNLLILRKIRVASGTTQTYTIVDGSTLYAVYTGSVFYLFPNADSAFVGSDPIYYGVTATITFTLQVWLSLIGTVNTTNFNPNY